MGDMADMICDWDFDEDGWEEDMEITGILTQISPKAILLCWDSYQEWLPKSQIENQPWEQFLNKKVTVNIPIWLANRKGIR